MKNSAVELCGITKKFGNTVAVDNLSFSVSEGELFSLLGVNGAGKTTTIRMLSGLSKPSGGDAFIMGHSILSSLSEVKPLIGISPQESSVSPNLTVFENLKLMAEIYGFSKEKAAEKAENILSSLSMEEEKDKKAKLLSGGYKRRLSIGMALVTDPKVLFLDEPSLGLDVLSRRELWGVISSLKGKITIILTTHYMEEAHRLSDRAAVIYKGKLKAVGTPSELMEKTGTDTLENAFIKLVGGNDYV